MSFLGQKLPSLEKLVRGGLTPLLSSLCTLHTLTRTTCAWPKRRHVPNGPQKQLQGHLFRDRCWSLCLSARPCSGLTHISCRGWLISILSLFTAGSAGPLDASASLPRSLISSEKDASTGTGREGLLKSGLKLNYNFIPTMQR